MRPYTDCQSGRTAAIAHHVSFAQITCEIHFNIVCRRTEMMHEQRVSCSGSRVIEHAVGEWRQRLTLAFVLQKDIF